MLDDQLEPRTSSIEKAKMKMKAQAEGYRLGVLPFRYNNLTPTYIGIFKQKISVWDSDKAISLLQSMCDEANWKSKQMGEI